MTFLERKPCSTEEYQYVRSDIVMNMINTQSIPLCPHTHTSKAMESAQNRSQYDSNANTLAVFAYTF